LIKLFANAPEDFDPDDLVPTLKQFDMASLGEIVRGLSGGDSRAVAIHSAILKTLKQKKRTATEMQA